MDMTDAKVVEKKIYEDGKKTEIRFQGCCWYRTRFGHSRNSVRCTSMVDRKPKYRYLWFTWR